MTSTARHSFCMLWIVVTLWQLHRAMPLSRYRPETLLFMSAILSAALHPQHVTVLCAVLAGRIAVALVWSTFSQVLEEIGAAHIPVLTVWNKIDLVPSRPLVSRHQTSGILRTQGRIPISKKHMSVLVQLESIAEGRDSVVCVSAQTGEGIPDLLSAIEEKIKKGMVLLHALIPFRRVRP